MGGTLPYYKRIKYYMKQLPTAEEFMLTNLQSMDQTEVENAMIEFAKLHVQAALESAAEEGQVEVVIIPNDQPSSSFGDDYTYIVDKESILTAYPLDKIK